VQPPTVAATSALDAGNRSAVEQPTVVHSSSSGVDGQPVVEWTGMSQPTASLRDPDSTPPTGFPVPQWNQHGTQSYAPSPKRPPRPADPLAVAVGNASLLGVGYWLLGSRVLAIVTTIVSVLLVLVLGPAVHTVWFEFVVVAWWLALVAHGWFLARARPRLAPARTHRLVAVAVAAVVLLAFGLLRFDAARIGTATTQARADGDCARARTATDRVWLGHRVVDAPLTADTDETVAACDRLRSAGLRLNNGLTPSTGELAAGFADLSAVLTTWPGHEKMVAATLDGFLDRLPIKDPCGTKEITDWLGTRKPRGEALAAATDIVPGIAPAAILDCADKNTKAENWEAALAAYSQLLTEYPQHRLAPRAEAGVTRATQAIELAKLRTLLTSTGGEEPPYCGTPSAYSAAAPYVAGRPNRALVFGNSAHTGKIPPGWLARDATEAVVVVCAGETEFGTPVETCPYEAKLSIGGTTDVTFRKIAIPTRVFEVRTGRLVAEFKLEIGGASCPAVLEYRSIGTVDLGPPSEVYVAASVADVQGAFRPLLIP
jgi:hypothetical protein